jgi:hypothetical protein
VGAVFCLAVTLIYLGFAPLNIDGMGYAAENLAAAQQMLASFAGRGPAAIEWPRHGFVEPMLGLPFLLGGRLLGLPGSADGALFSLLPLVSTALLSTVVLLWAAEAAGLVTGLMLAVTAAFATILWPYAYIGLEPVQSLFVMLAGYLALREGGPDSWPACIAFGAASGLAVSAKQNGAFLMPAVAYLVYCFFRRDARPPGRSQGARLTVVLLLLAIPLAFAVYTRSVFWAKVGGGALTFTTMGFREDEPLMMVFAAWSTLVSVNKGLLVFVPVTVLCLAACRRACGADRRPVIFALLVLGATVAGLSLLLSWSDETWGPRYLHGAIAPLIVCYGLARRGLSFSLRREAAWLGAGAAGAGIAFLGVFFYYGQLYRAATEAGISTLEAYQHDPDFNHIRFNWRLLRAWSRPSAAVERWPEPRFWVWSRPPANREPVAKIDLRRVAVPQPVIARALRPSAAVTPPPNPTLATLLASCLGLGLALMSWVARRVWAAEAARRPPDSIAPAAAPSGCGTSS